MLRILHTNNGIPKSYPVRLGGAYFEAGNLAKNYNTLPNYTIDLSNDENCIGIIDDIRNSIEDTTIGSGQIAIWNVPGLTFITDMHRCNFVASSGKNLSSPLYCNKGLFSISKLTSNQNPIATLTGFDFSPTLQSYFIEAIWL